MPRPVTERRRIKQRGSELIEMTLCLIPLLGLWMMVPDALYLSYTRATLMNAVENGVRFGMANRTDASGTMRSDYAERTLIEAEVRRWAGAVLPASTPLCNWDYGSNTLSSTDPCISIVWYDRTNPNNLAPMNAGANSAGNILVVSIENFQQTPLVPHFYDRGSLTYRSIIASDRMD